MKRPMISTIGLEEGSVVATCYFCGVAVRGVLVGFLTVAYSDQTSHEAMSAYDSSIFLQKLFLLCGRICGYTHTYECTVNCVTVQIVDYRNYPVA